MDLGLIFLTGLTTGGLTCLAVQGGLLTSLIASRAEEDLEAKSKRTHSAIPILLFLVAKLVAYTILGFGLGFLGSKLQLGVEVRVGMLIFVGLFMIASALRIIDAHPIFRYLSLQPPKFFYKLLRSQTKSKDYFAPVMLGFLTVFIPCGTTQAMEVLAITSGDPVLGAGIMFVFVLGTSPIFFIVGLLTTKLSDIFHKYFLRLAAVLVAVLGFLSIQSGLSLAGYPIKFDLLEISAPSDQPAPKDAKSSVNVVNGIQEVTINVYPRAYTPRNVEVSSSLPIRINMVTGGTYACTNSLYFPTLRKEVFLQANQTTLIDLGTQAPGNIYYVCSMGMYSGNIKVI